VLKDFCCFPFWSLNTLECGPGCGVHFATVYNWLRRTCGYGVYLATVYILLRCTFCLGPWGLGKLGYEISKNCRLWNSRHSLGGYDWTSCGLQGKSVASRKNPYLLYVLISVLQFSCQYLHAIIRQRLGFAMYQLARISPQFALPATAHPVGKSIQSFRSIQRA